MVKGKIPYAEIVPGQGIYMNSCIGDIDRKKIEIHLPGSLNAKQRVVHSRYLTTELTYFCSNT